MASWQHLELTVRADETYELTPFGAAMPPLEPGLRWWDVISDLGDQGWELVHVALAPAARQYWFKRPKRA